MPPAMRAAVRFWRPSRRRPDADIVSLLRALSQANGAHHHNRRALLASAARIVLNRDAPYPHGARTFEDVWTLIAIFVPISGALLGAGAAFYVAMSPSGRRTTTHTLRTRHGDRRLLTRRSYRRRTRPPPLRRPPWSGVEPRPTLAPGARGTPRPAARRIPRTARRRPRTGRP